jgi:competence protein ComEC
MPSLGVVQKKIIVVMSLLAMSSFGIYINFYTETPGDFLRVTFLNIGQGDAIFVETPDNIQLLIDGGPDASVIRELSQVMPWYDRTIDMVIGTHPDKDHIGGLIDVFARYAVATVVTTENRGETLVATTYRQSLDDEGVHQYMARSGQVFQLGDSVTLTILSPAADPSLLESNTASIVAKLQYGDVGFMLTGDAPIGIEEYLVRTYGKTLESEVLKLGHHGSKTSTSRVFLSAVAPEYAVVSAGRDNSYGHPHAEVVASVIDFGSQLKETKNGRVTFVSDGKAIWQE